MLKKGKKNDHFQLDFRVNSDKSELLPRKVCRIIKAIPIPFSAFSPVNLLQSFDASLKKDFSTAALFNKRENFFSFSTLYSRALKMTESFYVPTYMLIIFNKVIFSKTNQPKFCSFFHFVFIHIAINNRMM